MSKRQNALAQQRRREQQRRTLYFAISVVLVIAAVVAVVVTRDDNASAGETGTVTVAGAPLPEFTSSTGDPAVGQPIPTVSGTNFDGAPVAIANDGKPKVILFAAHWCPHCQKEIPLLAGSLLDEPLPDGVEMITVSTAVNSSAPNYPPSEWLRREDWPTPVIADDAESSAAEVYGLTSYPYFVFVDGNGKVVSRYAGEMPLPEFRAAVASITDSST